MTATRSPTGHRAPAPVDPASAGRKLRARLAEASLSLAVLDAAALEPDQRDALAALWPRSRPDPLRVLLAYNAGGAFADPVDLAAAPDPIDRHCRRVTAAALDGVMPAARYRIVYPGAFPVSLQRLGRAAGLGAPSWLGVAIDPEYGTWFAFRAIVLSDFPLPLSPPRLQTDVCATCTTRDCLEVCPVDAPGAPHAGRGFDLDACAGHRLAARSACADDCVARRACPAGAGWRYPPALLRYLYARSLPDLARWKGRS